jgi:hypothetical protein
LRRWGKPTRRWTCGTSPAPRAPGRALRSGGSLFAARGSGHFPYYTTPSSQLPASSQLSTEYRSENPTPQVELFLLSLCSTGEWRVDPVSGTEEPWAVEPIQILET